ncbi:hypothetical protein MKW94_003695 [Papaver nudicaule]|uniref:C2H2-type domain-containing protein n=1 Tax=Papaver nudicaule TaxID=74823 RepID=A0AA41V889_PAPNU|nr:hypothetical protein [Papaver nudicaule]
MIVEEQNKNSDLHKHGLHFRHLDPSRRWNSRHYEETENKGIDEKEEAKSSNTCEDCGASFRKPAQHMQSHSLERPFTCHVDDSHSSYRRKDHLNRHLLQHQGKLFSCNMKRHIENIHEDEGSSSSDSQGQTQHICQEMNVCSTKQLKKNVERHMRAHENEGSSERIKCSFKGCNCTYATKSNLNQHVKVVHLELRPFPCQFPGCGQRFSFKHVRITMRTLRDFVEADEQFQNRPRGGRKRTCPTVESLLKEESSSTQSC